MFSEKWPNVCLDQAYIVEYYLSLGHPSNALYTFLSLWEANHTIKCPQSPSFSTVAETQ